MPESDVLQGITTWPGDIDQDIRLESAHLFQDTIGRESPRVEIVLYMYRNIGIVERNIRSSGRTYTHVLMSFFALRKGSKALMTSS